VFKVGKNGETVLYSFKGHPDGGGPNAGLTGDSEGNVYGTTCGGGTGGFYHYGEGTVYKLDSTGNETVLYSFAGTPDGECPQAGLIRDAMGNLYGTTNLGGAYGSGTVFELNTSGTETVLYSFTGAADGANPRAGLVLDAAGNFYGTAMQGGNFTGCNYGCGLVFKLDPAGVETVLHTFTAGTDGATPEAGLIIDTAGNLYGTTAYGGDLSACINFVNGCGVVFKLDPSGIETVLHAFRGGADGIYPNSGLTRDKIGNLYGTTFGGGSQSSCSADISGCGMAYEIDPTGKETVLHRFGGGADGAYPFAGLTLDPEGNLYGTTQFGGANYICGNGELGCGVVFRIKP
jgi:uncharacterized repeat protein (TIGR03803 family)